MNPFPYRHHEHCCEDIPVSRITEEFGTPVWCASDNLRNIAATNAVQIAELLAKQAG